MASNPAWTDEELILAVELIDRRGWKGGNSTTPDYVELSRVLRHANFPNQSSIDDSFRSTSSVSMKIGNLIGANPNLPGGLRATERERLFVARFFENPTLMRALAQSLRTGAGTAAIPPEADTPELDDEEATVAIEGGASYVLTLRRERSRSLRRSKIREVEEAGAPIACEACGFDFLLVYGELGRSYIEVHHRTPLHVSGETESAHSDLALLCSNCHRMVHRNGWSPVEAIRALVEASRGMTGPGDKAT
ncbi:HNH endonuclease [Microbacterium chocolatum]|uniref:HNH endonuclease n=1 Tax=Microbacterium aurantiacum TaxID=162393 RepID=UPI00338F6C88